MNNPLVAEFIGTGILLLLGWLAYKSSKATKEKDRKKRTKRKNK